MLPPLPPTLKIWFSIKFKELFYLPKTENRPQQPHQGASETNPTRRIGSACASNPKWAGMTPGWPRDDPKMIPGWSHDDPKIIPRWPQKVIIFWLRYVWRSESYPRKGECHRLKIKFFSYLKATFTAADPKNQIFQSNLKNSFMNALQIYADFWMGRRW